MDGSWSPPPKGRSQRIPIELPVVIERGGAQFNGRTANVGFGGAFIEAAQHLAYGDQVELWLPLPNVALLCPLRSVVRWTSGTGFGVQFLEIGAQVVFGLAELMKSNATDDRMTLTNLETDLDARPLSGPLALSSAHAKIQGMQRNLT